MRFPILVISPNRDALEPLIIFTVPQVLLAHYTVSSGSIDEVFESNCSGETTFLLRPGCRNWFAQGRRRVLRNGVHIHEFAFKFYFIHFGLIKDLCTTLSGVLEEYVVGLGANHIPRVIPGSASG